MKQIKCIKCFREMNSIQFPDLDRHYQCNTHNHFYSIYFKNSSLVEFDFTQFDEEHYHIYYLEIYSWRASQIISCQFLKENSVKNEMSLDDYIINNLSEKILNDTLTLDYVKSIIDKLENLAIFI